MYKMDKDFKDAIDVFVNTIEESDDIIGIEATRVHNGFYGIISSMDFAALPGSTFSVIAQILERTPIAKEYKQAIMASNSWGLNGIYVFGDRYTRVLQRCRNVQKAIEVREKVHTLRESSV
jgi:hypothetical protein